MLHGGRERAHRLLERRVGIESVRVEDVDVVEARAAEALIEAREQVLPRATALPVRPRPHVPAGFRRDDQLVPMPVEVLSEQPAEVDLGAPVRRPVVVGEVEVRDPEVEGGAEHRSLRVQRRRVAEVLPEAERDRRELQPAPSTGAVRHAVVSILGSLVRHGCTVPEPTSASLGVGKKGWWSPRRQARSCAENGNGQRTRTPSRVTTTWSPSFTPWPAPTSPA